MTFPPLRPLWGTPWPRGARTAALASLLLLLTVTPQAMAQEDEEQARQLVGVFAEVYEFILDNYVDATRVDPELLIEGALDGMFEALDDPYSAYIRPDEVTEINDLTRGEFGGVGMYVAGHRDGGVEVISPIEGQPAYRAGVRPGDLIVAVDGEPALEFEVSDIIPRLRGEPGTTVTITFRRHDAVTFDVAIERAMIEVVTVRHALIHGAVGYLRISQFTRLTPERVAEALQELEGAAGLVVDLRSNPGGLLSAVVQVADYFLSSGVIVATRSRVEAENQVHAAEEHTTLADAELPLVVLIDRGSASASEILAAALGENGRAYLLGEQTYGKGSVQQVRHFDERAVKVTTAHYLTPSGVSIDEVGVAPHQELGEPERSEEEQADLEALFESGRVRAFVRAHPAPSGAQVETFITELVGSGVGLDRFLLRRLVHDEVRRSMPAPPVYDLRFDLVLREAVRLLQQGLVPASGAQHLRAPAAAAGRGGSGAAPQPG